MTEKLSPLALLFLPILASACGDSGSGNQPNPSGVTITGSVNISGAQAASGAFVRIEFTDRPSCVDLAVNGSASTDPGGAEGTFKIPGPVVGAPLEPSGDLYASTLRIPQETYDGPGTYVTDGEVVEILGQITLDEFPAGPTFFLDQGTTVAIIMEDGSGTLTFEDLRNDEGTSTISGSVTWTCSDE